VLLAEQLPELVGAAVELAQSSRALAGSPSPPGALAARGVLALEHLGGVAQVLDAFAPLVQRPALLALAGGGPAQALSALAVEALQARLGDGHAGARAESPLGDAGAHRVQLEDRLGQGGLVA
jgi:hypothetical protein